MNDERTPGSPLVPEQAPEHGPDFWNQLDQAMNNDIAATTSVAAGAPADDATAQMPRLTALDGGKATTSMPATPGIPTKQGIGTRWPLAAAAIAVVVLGLGFLAVRGPSEPTTTTEIVEAPDTGADAASSGGTDGDEPSDTALADSDTGEGDTGEGDTALADGDAADGETAESNTAQADSDTALADGDTAEDATGDTAGDAEPGAVVVVPTPLPAPPIPDFDSARGAVGDPDHVPLDGGVAADGTFLANWPERRLTWFAVNDPDTSCASAGHSEILYVNRSGITQQMRDPQMRFSGEISHFVVNAERNLGAWVVACGNQLELFVATLEPTGRISELTLAWLGEGSTSSALVLWDGGEVSLNAIEPDGDVFAVSYNVDNELVSRNGGPSRIMLEAGAPSQRSLTPIAASPDGGLTYWTGTAPAGTVSACSELFGSGRSDTLWLRQGEGQWQLAAADDFPLGTVTAAALDSDRLRMAFADVCPGESGRVTVGTQLPDGRIGDLQEIDLTPYVPGYVAELFWIDEFTLRMETDNTEFGFDTVRFDYRLDQDLIVQLD